MKDKIDTESMGMEPKPVPDFGKREADKSMKKLAARQPIGNRNYDPDKIKEDMKKLNLGPQYAPGIGLITLEET